MPKRNLFVLIMMVVTAVVAWLARDRAGHGRRFAEVLGAIERTYLEPVDQQSLFDAAMEGVFSRLDEHSAFVVGDRRDQLERELAVALATLELWRDRAFDANAGEEFVEIASLLGELKTMRRDYEEGWEL
jgi:carboxyl-terminal processing protease